MEPMQSPTPTANKASGVAYEEFSIWIEGARRVPPSVLSYHALSAKIESMLSLQNAGKRFGPRVLFLEANWLIRRGKDGAVGANGTGKSTLMKVLAAWRAGLRRVQQTRGMSIVTCRRRVCGDRATVLKNA